MPTVKPMILNDIRPRLGSSARPETTKVVLLGQSVPYAGLAISMPAIFSIAVTMPEWS